ncbi:MAG: N-6 DNA methylase, partial [Candidatus Lokiarchaeota archaeon]|nr:N-6 DNA methylase [Candidatus Lokiarchaeota archaeon]
MHPQRNKHDIGEYYTPKSIAYYLTLKAILYYLNNEMESYSLEKELNLNKKATSVWREKISNLNILDPSCGDGVFLKTATTILFDLNRKLDNNDTLSEKRSDKLVLEELITHNIHGVDINKYKIKKSNLDFINEFKIDAIDSKLYPIKYGNALIEDSEFPSYFNWNKEYKSIMKDGGFDIIIGNPPWGADMNKYKSYLCSKYPRIAFGQFDSFA